MTQHTPGPWTIEQIIPEGEPQFWPIAGPHTFKVADVYLSEIDARLIAAAPEMLDALKELIAEFDEESRQIADTDPGCYGLVETGGIAYARALLARIEGK